MFTEGDVQGEFVPEQRLSADEIVPGQHVLRPQSCLEGRVRNRPEPVEGTGVFAV